ncbi:HNH endonuclease [Lysobacteraceae bacterium NML91-0213]|nr:HNH endonuclease [Xanthomonadaceae bacterium NML91-0213]
MRGRPWTPDEDETLRLNYPNFPAFLIAHVLGRTTSMVHNRAHVLGLAKSPDFARHPMAHLWNGTADPRSVEKRFKKGQMAGAAQHNYVPIGTLRVKDGVLARKVTDDPTLYPARRWVPVHRTVWEAAHGPVPAGHVVRFRAGMKTTDEALITVDRLELVTHAENMRLNTIHRYPPELRAVMKLAARVRRAIDKKAQAE